jgi:hypothetical protein
MTIPVETLAAEVLRLPSADRARLLDRIVASLDTDRQRDEAWDALAARRDQEIESGASEAVAGPAVLARLRAALA